MLLSKSGGGFAYALIIFTKLYIYILISDAFSAIARRMKTAFQLIKIVICRLVIFSAKPCAIFLAPRDQFIAPTANFSFHSSIEYIPPAAARARQLTHFSFNDLARASSTSFRVCVLFGIVQLRCTQTRIIKTNCDYYIFKSFSYNNLWFCGA